jgi:SulP family sulfate permease
MAVETAGASRTRTGLWHRGSSRDLFAGTICGVLTAAYCLSYAALIFAGPLKQWLSYGVAMTFLSAAVAAAVVAMRSSLPFAIAGPDASTSAVMAALVAAMVQHLTEGGRADLLEPVLVVMVLSTGVTGLLLWVLGMTRAGRAIRFVPYPVIGGFLGATGWLMMLGALQVVTDHRPRLEDFHMLFDAVSAAKLAAGLAVAIVLQLALSRSNNPFLMLAILAVAVLALHVGVRLAGATLAEAQAGGWTFQPQPAVALSLPWRPAELQSFPWAVLPSLTGDLLAVMFVTTISLLLNTTGVEIATHSEADIERELKALGLANLLTAAVGGYVSCLALGRTTLGHTAGGTGRMTGLTVAAISAGFLVADPALLGHMPKYALGGLLFYLGARLVYQWLVQSARQLLLIEYLSLLAIAVIIIQWGFIAGVLIGVIIGCATFALSASRINAIKFSFDGSEYRSSLDRGADELALLAAHGHQIQGVALQSYLFFGSANRLYQHVKALLARRPDCRFLLFDFRLVTGIDSSATHSFSQIKEAADSAGVRLVLVNMTPDLERAFHLARLSTRKVDVATNLDRALESCEQAVIAAHRAGSDEAQTLHEWLSKALGGAEHADRLVQHCRRIDVQPGEVIAREGEPTHAMHFVLEGRVGIVVDFGDRRAVRVRSLGPRTTIGEMGLIAGRPRSATIQAELASVLYELPAARYEEIKRNDPALGQALLSYVIAVMAERLSFASRAIGVLQR